MNFTLSQISGFSQNMCKYCLTGEQESDWMLCIVVCKIEGIFL